MNIIKQPRTEVIKDPETGKLTEMTHDILMLKNMAQGQWGYVRWIDQAKGQLDLSELGEVEGMPNFPAGLEVILMDCDARAPVIPVRFTYEGTYYTDVYFYAENLKYVTGPNGKHLK